MKRDRNSGSGKGTTGEIVFIDGYNLLFRRYRPTDDLEPLRTRLERLLVLWNHRGRKRVVLVYDGQHGIIQSTGHQPQVLEVRFTRPPVIADNFIISAVTGLCDRGVPPGRIAVVTSDVRDIWAELEPRRVQLIHAHSFWEEIEREAAEQAKTHREAPPPDHGSAARPAAQGSLEDIARQFGWDPDQEVKLGGKRPTPAARPAASTPAPPKQAAPSRKTAPGPARADSGGGEALPGLKDLDAWEKLFSSKGPDTELPAGPVRPKLAQHRILGAIEARRVPVDPKRKQPARPKGPKDTLPPLADFDSWIEEFGGDPDEGF